jgi:hypothetical protein
VHGVELPLLSVLQRTATDIALWIHGASDAADKCVLFLQLGVILTRRCKCFYSVGSLSCFPFFSAPYLDLLSETYMPSLRIF